LKVKDNKYGAHSKIYHVLYPSENEKWETMYIQCNIKAHSSNHCCCGKAISIKYSEWVSVYLPCLCGMQRACAVLYCHVWSVWSTLSLKQHDFCKKKLLNIKCVFWFFLQLLSERFLTLRWKKQDIIINVHRSLCEVPIILVGF
jgi:hypothetical protein